MAALVQSITQKQHYLQHAGALQQAAGLAAAFNAAPGPDAAPCALQYQSTPQGTENKSPTKAAEKGKADSPAFKPANVFGRKLEAVPYMANPLPQHKVGHPGGCGVKAQGLNCVRLLSITEAMQALSHCSSHLCSPGPTWP